MRKIIIVLLSVMSLSLTAVAQNKKGSNLTISANGWYGYDIERTRPNLKCAGYMTYEASVGFQSHPNDSNYYSRAYGFPLLSVGFQVANMGDFKFTDNTKFPCLYSLYGAFERSLYRSKYVSLGYQLEFGITYNPERYDPVNNPNNNWLSSPIMAYFGGGVLDENYNSIIDSKETKEGLDFYNNLVHKYKVAPTKSQIGSSTLAQMFLEQKIVMYLSGRWMYPKIQEKAGFNWAVVNFPYGKSLQYCDVSGWVISKNSKHIESALKFVEFLSSEKSSIYFAQTGLIVPARITISKNLDSTNHNERIFLEVINKSQKTPVSKDYKK